MPPKLRRNPKPQCDGGCWRPSAERGQSRGPGEGPRQNATRRRPELGLPACRTVREWGAPSAAPLTLVSPRPEGTEAVRARVAGGAACDEEIPIARDLDTAHRAGEQGPGTEEAGSSGGSAAAGKDSPSEREEGRARDPGLTEMDVRP